MLLHRLARSTAQALQGARSRLALRALTRHGVGPRLVGAPRIEGAGAIVLGDGVTLVSRPAPVTLVAGPRGRIEIGDAAVLEAGCTIVARGRVVVGAGAHLGPGCLVMDSAAAPSGISIGQGATLEAGALLLDGAVLADGARLARGEALGTGAAPSLATAPVAANPQPAGHLEKLRAAVASVVQAAAGADPADDLKHLEGWDSLAAINVLVAVEESFGVALPSNALTGAPTLGSLSELVLARTMGRGP